jgi:hypothetical protein
MQGGAERHRLFYFSRRNAEKDRKKFKPSKEVLLTSRRKALQRQVFFPVALLHFSASLRETVLGVVCSKKNAVTDWQPPHSFLSADGILCQGSNTITVYFYR